jgi:hypothetical protein
MTDHNHGWTAQSQHGWTESEGVPGNTFTEDQLPDPNIQRLAGIDPEQYRSQHGLWVEESDNEPPQFRGTRSGLTPAQVLASNMTHESFRSYYADPDSE